LFKCNVVQIRMGGIFMKLVDLTKELGGLHLLMETIFFSKEKPLEQHESLKVAWDNEFNDSVELSKEEVER